MRARPPRVPGYVLGARLGGGPTSDVYSAVEEVGGRVWALKILRDEALHDDTNLHLFRREAKVGLSVRHPHLVRFARAETYLMHPYHLVMERLPGECLRASLKREEWFDGAVAIRYIRHVAEALAALHAAKYIHGDVKPDNVHLVDERTAKLIDLGFAHQCGEDEELLGKGYVLGTANYIAPELCHDPAVDVPAADIFSLGVMFFELLTGKLPYPEGTVEETMLRHRDDKAESLQAWQGHWPADLPLLIDAMLQRNPGKRPSARAVVMHLTRMQHRLPIY
jgi:serine/threonine protein kinase